METRNIGIVGGGVAGLFTAWFLAKKGHRVTVMEAGRVGQGCTRMAAGMLAPINELEFGEMELLKAGIASRDLYHEIQAELGDIGLIRNGTFEVALEKDDVGYLERQFEYQQSHGLKVQWMRGAAIQDMEPWLSRHIPAAIWSPEDIQLDNRKLPSRLKESIIALGGRVMENTRILDWEGNGPVRVWGEKLDETFDSLAITIGVPRDLSHKIPYTIYPVKGEMLALEPPSGEFLNYTIRIRNKTLGNGYIVPKEGRILVGSTSEEKGLDDRNTAGGLLDILRRGYAAVPGIYELPILETWAGLRPSSLSREPILGKEKGREIYHLNGLYRHGILLSPICGKAIAELISHQYILPEVAGFFTL